MQFNTQAFSDIRPNSNNEIMCDFFGFQQG